MYSKFKKIDGTHPWREACPNGYIDYPVRYRDGGRVLLFNFDLAREMGLIDKDHPDKMNAKLEQAILDAFSLQVVNEYDQTYKTKAFYSRLENKRYMATRYLQLQHNSKTGKTSGDGRSIWNGCICSKGLTYDISSCGTGATQLSPGAQETDALIKTGDENVCYGSGTADLSDMLAGAVMSEILYQEGIPTERNLTVIGFRDNTSIGVRSAPNLIRPAHIFRYLKTGDYEELKSSYDYFLSRQVRNGFWTLPKGKDRYAKSLDYFAQTYARLSAVLEEEYIFNWLAWDGDNMLATGALLDYGSIRRFAAKHDQYRYEDTDRFSTSLTEQKYWARSTVQTFAQAVDFIVNGKKKRLDKFSKHASLKVFDQQFIEERQRRMLWRMGFNPKQADKLLKDHYNKVIAFRGCLNYFEDIKTSKGKTKVADGVDHPPVFLIRHILRELPMFLLKHQLVKNNRWPQIEPKTFCRIMAGSYVNRKDLQLTPARTKKSELFQYYYEELVRSAGKSPRQVLRSMVKRSAVINYEHRSTGDGLIEVINEAMKAKSRLETNQFQQLLKRFIESQVLVPGKWKAIDERELKRNTKIARYLRRFQDHLELYKDLI